jgi:hypothetical protein
MRVLICPLDWGMGHTTRMIPVAAKLLSEDNKVVFGGSSRQLALINSDLPEAGTLLFPGFTTRYSKWLPMYLHMILRVPLFIVSVIAEHRKLRSLLGRERFDMVISDNRMGLWSRKVNSVYVTHMLRIPMPRLLRFLEPVGAWIHRLVINRYDECWIPDEPGGKNLSGRLSHDIKLPERARYIGILSKYSVCSDKEMAIPGELIPLLDRPWSSLILSGPEPQRSLLRTAIAGRWQNTDELLVVFEGNAEGRSAITRTGMIISVPHLKPCPMAAVIKGSHKIYSRSGYTTIMELASLGRYDSRAVLIPTPGQTEQEYLAQKQPWLTPS